VRASAGGGRPCTGAVSDLMNEVTAQIKWVLKIQTFGVCKRGVRAH